MPCCSTRCPGRPPFVLFPLTAGLPLMGSRSNIAAKSQYITTPSAPPPGSEPPPRPRACRRPFGRPTRAHSVCKPHRGHTFPNAGPPVCPIQRRFAGGTRERGPNAAAPRALEAISPAAPLDAGALSAAPTLGLSRMCANPSGPAHWGAGDRQRGPVHGVLLSVTVGHCRLLSVTAAHCRLLSVTVVRCRLLWVTVGYCRLLPGTVDYCRLLRRRARADRGYCGDSLAGPYQRMGGGAGARMRWGAFRQRSVGLCAAGPSERYIANAAPAPSVVEAQPSAHPSTPGCGMRMLHANPYHTGTRPQSDSSQNKKLFSDIATGAFRGDGMQYPVQSVSEGSYRHHSIDCPAVGQTHRLRLRGNACPARAHHPNPCSGHPSQCSPPPPVIPGLGVPFFTIAKAQGTHARLEQVVARECMAPSALGIIAFSWALQEVPQIPLCWAKVRKSRTDTCPPNRWRWDGDR